MDKCQGDYAVTVKQIMPQGGIADGQASGAITYINTLLSLRWV
jgi:hypothetical protein